MFFAFLVVPFLDGFAKGSRMFAIESSCERLSERTYAKVGGQHVRPRHRLEDGPMPARRNHERDDHQQKP